MNTRIITQEIFASIVVLGYGENPTFTIDEDDNCSVIFDGGYFLAYPDAVHAVFNDVEVLFFDDGLVRLNKTTQDEPVLEFFECVKSVLTHSKVFGVPHCRYWRGEEKFPSLRDGLKG